VLYTLQIGHLDPIPEISGLQGRLRNLGYYGGPIHGNMDGATASAWQDFKRGNGLGDSPDLDRGSLSALEQQHEPQSASSLTGNAEPSGERPV
jgi:peptidoglycan hydrolase-like protein with peptidoglycan-binding domain